MTFSNFKAAVSVSGFSLFDRRETWIAGWPRNVAVPKPPPRQPDLTTAVYYEKYPTKGVLLVPRESADPGLTGVEPVPIDKDHVSICKPESVDDTVFLGVKRHIHRVLKSVGEPTSGSNGLTLTDDYRERSGLDDAVTFSRS